MDLLQQLLAFACFCVPALLWGGCCCNNAIPCTACSGSTPLEMELTMTGWAIGMCTDGSMPTACLDWNATFILSQVSACGWRTDRFVCPVSAPVVTEIFSASLGASPRRVNVGLSSFAGDLYIPGGAVTWNCSSGSVIVPAGRIPSSLGLGGCDPTGLTYGLSVV